MQVEHAELSLIGNREENQDRVAVAEGDGALLLVVIDGMGGHSDGAEAARVAAESIVESFRATPKPVFDPQGFLHRAIGRAHAALVAMGQGLRMEARPRATCALCLVQDEAAFWAHVGDSRIYHVRNRWVHERTRDHSHVELLLQEGLITEDEMHDHPMRNFVECCLGGDVTLSGMTITNRRSLSDGDRLLLCTDGLWAGLGDDEIGAFGSTGAPLLADLRRISELAVRACDPYADNTSGVAARVSA